MGRLSVADLFKDHPARDGPLPGFARFNAPLLRAEAAAVGHATARAIPSRPRDERMCLFPGNRTWYILRALSEETYPE
jgi:hypothetical protein